MKVAVCVSGIPRTGLGDDVKRITSCLNNAHDALPYDFFFATWNGYEDIAMKAINNSSISPRDLRMNTSPEPVVNYHPYNDIPDEMMISERMRKSVKRYRVDEEMKETTKHQTKQIIAHARLVKKLPYYYDMVVRMRYDSFIHPNAHFLNFIEESMDRNIAIGFATMKEDWNKFDKVRWLECKHPARDRFLFDHLIIHPREIFDPDEVFALDHAKLLCAAEYGWWQVLCKRQGNNHDCYSGWVNPIKNLPPKWRKNTNA